jgi:hypothetical protein
MIALRDNADYQTPLRALETLVCEHSTTLGLENILQETQDQLNVHLGNGFDVASSFVSSQLQRAEELVSAA